MKLTVKQLRKLIKEEVDLISNDKIVRETLVTLIKELQNNWDKVIKDTGRSFVNSQYVQVIALEESITLIDFILSRNNINHKMVDKLVWTLHNKLPHLSDNINILNKKLADLLSLDVESTDW